MWRLYCIYANVKKHSSTAETLFMSVNFNHRYSQIFNIVVTFSIVKHALFISYSWEWSGITVFQPQNPWFGFTFIQGIQGRYLAEIFFKNIWSSWQEHYLELTNFQPVIDQWRWIKSRWRCSDFFLSNDLEKVWWIKHKNVCHLLCSAL